MEPCRGELNRIVFIPITTDRLVLRSFTSEDAADLATRRSHPQVARYQNWESPFPVAEAERVASELAAMEGPANNEWWMAIVADAESGTTVGDLAVHLTWNGRSAEIGYNLDPMYWGKGFAVEAVGALVDYLFDEFGVTRVFGMLHPDNLASALVLERTGFVFEGHTRSSYWDGDEVSDDWIYGMIGPDRYEWHSRPKDGPDDVSLVEITPDNQDRVARLRTHKTQERFVSPMGESFADAMFPEVIDGAAVVPWLRAVTADGEIVGFVMVALMTQHHGEPYLWRLLISRLHQRRGIGGRVIELVAEDCRNRGATTLLTSWSEGRGSPRPFYERQGFTTTGRIVDGEAEARKLLN